MDRHLRFTAPLKDIQSWKSNDRRTVTWIYDSPSQGKLLDSKGRGVGLGGVEERGY